MLIEFDVLPGDPGTKSYSASTIMHIINLEVEKWSE
jgi:hypothetical protein